MKKEERIKKAKCEINMLWNESEYWSNREGSGSEQSKCWAARWLSASDMFYILTGERYLGE